MVMKIITAAIIVALSCVAYAEGYVENIVLYHEDDGLVTVCYDLVSEEPKRITLVGKANGFDLEIESVSGDVGVMITSGVNKCIFWETLQDYPEGFKEYAVSLDLLVSDYAPIGEFDEPQERALPEGHVPAVPQRVKKKALSEDEMLKIIAEHAEKTRKSKKDCDKSTKRFEKADGSNSKTRLERLSVQRDYDCRDFNVLKRQLIDYVQTFEDHAKSKKAKKYLRVLE
jgi:hypothetical protein